MTMTGIGGYTGLGAEGVEMSSMSVSDLQRLLLKKGFSVGPAGIDGLWGPDTKGAYEAACGSEEIFVDPAFCDLIKVAPTKRYVSLPSVVRQAMADLPDRPISPPPRPRGAPVYEPGPLDTVLRTGKAKWPWGVAAATFAALAGGVWWLDREYGAPRAVKANRGKR